MEPEEKEENGLDFRGEAAKVFSAAWEKIAPVATTQVNEVAISPVQELVEHYLKSLKPASARAMESGLNLVARAFSGGKCHLWDFPWHRLDQKGLLLIQRTLRAHYADGTVSKLMTGIRGLLRTAWQRGLITAEAYLQGTVGTQVKVSALRHGRSLSQTEVRSLLAACRAESSASGKRDAAIIAFMLCGGLSVTEVLALSRGDYQEQQGIVSIHYRMETAGEGDATVSVYQRQRKEYKHKRRKVMVGPRASQVIQEWVCCWEASFGAEAPDSALFCAVNKSNQLILQHLTRQAINDLLKKRAGQAQISAFSPNDLRKTYLQTLLSRGYDASTIRDLAGYARTQTVGYFQPGVEKIEEIKPDQPGIPIVDLPE